MHNIRTTDLHEYTQLQGDSQEVAAERKKRYAHMVDTYYNLATDLYERGWGRSFHFAPRYRDETLAQSIVRHELFLAHQLGLGPASRVLDVGCGVGGPMRTIADSSGADITGITINRYQKIKGDRYNREARLDDRCRIVQGDFMAMPFGDAEFDAGLAIESTCHAPDRRVVFSEVFRTLRPGGVFGGFEWCLTDAFDPGRADHRTLKRQIEEGNGIPDLTQAAAVDGALQDAGFDVLTTRDMAGDGDPQTPWYLPMSWKAWNVNGLACTRAGRRVVSAVLHLAERIRAVPEGTGRVHRMMAAGGAALAECGQRGLFTPMYFFLARKPGPR